jgi:hypothetical protein
MVCRFAEPRSRSIRRVFLPDFAKRRPKELAKKLLPDPPLPPPIGQICAISHPLIGFGKVIHDKIMIFKYLVAFSGNFLWDYFLDLFLFCP